MDVNPYESPQSAPGRSRPAIILAIGACLLLVLFCVLAVGIPRSWVFDYDTETHAGITKKIAAPQRLAGRRFDEVSRELGLEGVLWDDVVVQTMGTCRMYHFRGFALIIHLEYAWEKITQDMRRDLPEEKLRARDDLLHIHPHFHPSVTIDGISSREERMRQYQARLEAEFERINNEMDSHRQQRRNP
jgi:hypothetical protein